MSSTTADVTARINALLAPHMFQVIGSTPASIRDALEKSTLKSNPGDATLVAATCVFAAAVNKSTLENFVSQPELMNARTTITASLSINGKINMTGVTLLGHCLLTSPHVSGIDFVKEFRHKMGQDHLWDGDFSKGALSDKQKGIMNEKKRVTPFDRAELLGKGFFKYTGLDYTPMTAEEQAFWGGSQSSSSSFPPRRPAPGPVPESTYGGNKGEQSGFRTRTPTPEGTAPPEEMAFATLDGKNGYYIPRILYDYYLEVNRNDLNKLMTSIERNGKDKWIHNYRMIEKRDPERKGVSGSTVVS